MGYLTHEVISEAYLEYEEELSETLIVVTDINHPNNSLRETYGDGRPILPNLYKLVADCVLVSQTTSDGDVFVAGYPTGNIGKDGYGDTITEAKRVPSELRAGMSEFLKSKGIEGRLAFR